jgi:hypothetical protein
MEVKGTAIVTMPMFIRERFGEAGHATWLAALEPEAQKAFREPILPSNWYPLKATFTEPSRIMCRLFFAGNLRGAWENGRYSAAYGLRGIYKFFVKLGTVDFIIKKASIILPTYYHPSTMVVKNASRNHTTLHVTQFPEMDPLMEARICGWIEQALEINGCKDIKIETTQSLTKGNPVTEFQIGWR